MSQKTTVCGHKPTSTRLRSLVGVVVVVPLDASVNVTGASPLTTRALE
jgi:hypothetical protein